MNKKRDNKKQKVINSQYLRIGKEIYFILLFLFIFYEKPLFNRVFTDIADYALFGTISVGVSFLYLLIIKKINVNVLFILNGLFILIIGFVFYLISFFLPLDQSLDALTHWIFGKWGHIFLAFIILGLMPSSLYEVGRRLFKFSDSAEVERMAPRYWILAFFMLFLGGLSYLKYMYALLFAFVPCILQIFCIFRLYSGFKKKDREGNKEEYSLMKKVKLNPLSFLRMAFNLAVVSVFALSTIDNDEFLFSLLFQFGVGIMLFSFVSAIFSKIIEKNRVFLVLLLATYLCFMSSLLVTIKIIQDGFNLRILIGIPPYTAGFGLAFLSSLMEQKMNPHNNIFKPSKICILKTPFGIDSDFQGQVKLLVHIVVVFLVSIIEISPNGTDNLLIYLIGIVISLIGLSFNLILEQINKR